MSNAHTDPRPLEVEQAIFAEQMRLVLTHAASGALISSLFALFIGMQWLQGAFGHALPHTLVMGWLVVKLGVAAMRLLHAQRCRQLDGVGLPAPFRWTVPLLALDGATWGAAGAVLMGGPGSVATPVGAVLCCVACVATLGLQARTAAAMAYVLPMLGPVVVALLARADQIGLLGGFGLMGFLALLARTSRAWQEHVAQLIALRIEKELASRAAAAATSEAEINAEKLGLALRQADALTKSRERYLSVVSHELRTSIQAILGLLRAMRRDMAQGQEQEQHHSGNRHRLLQDSGEHLSRLADDLLDTGALEGGLLSLRPEPMNLLAVVSRAYNAFAAHAADARLNFTVQVDPQVPPWVIGDSVRITQVLTNLLTNAVTFTPTGGRVALRLVHEPASSTVIFTVEDSGPGLSEADVDRLRQPFVQVLTKAGSRPGGGGLGLAISQQLARAMGGHVQCLQTSPRGSMFEFTARLAQVLMGPSARQHIEKAAVSPEVEDSTLAGARALIVDNDHVSAIVACEVARSVGCVAEHFSAGDEVLRRFAVGATTDIVVLNFDMPGLDGDAIADAIRHYETVTALPRTPIICVTERTAIHEVPTSESIDEVLARPCAPAELAAAIKRQLQRARRDGAAGKLPVLTQVVDGEGPAHSHPTKV